MKACLNNTGFDFHFVSFRFTFSFRFVSFRPVPFRFARFRFVSFLVLEGPLLSSLIVISFHLPTCAREINMAAGLFLEL